jgi:hypothetical protein
VLPQALPRLTPMSLMGGWTLAFNLNQSVVDHLQRRRLPATGGVWDRGMQRQPMTGPLALGRKAQAVCYHSKGLVCSVQIEIAKLATAARWRWRRPQGECTDCGALCKVFCV